jgi:C_GCAxxG_C_C family probable redox protein
MKKSFTRRTFLARLALTIGSVSLLSSCIRNKQTDLSPGSELAPDSGFQKELQKNRQLPKELVMIQLDQKVDLAMQRSFHCAQSSFLALNEHFSLGGEQVIKALTPLPGVAERGETCGAVIGPLMAFGLIYGRDQLQMDNWEKYQESLVPAGKLCTQFEQEFGSTMCHEVQKVKFGKCYHLTDSNELRQFQEAGATDHCSDVVRKAVRMAAEIILEDPSL